MMDISSPDLRYSGGDGETHLIDSMAHRRPFPASSALLTISWAYDPGHTFRRFHPLNQIASACGCAPKYFEPSDFD